MLATDAGKENPIVPKLLNPDGFDHQQGLEMADTQTRLTQRADTDPTPTGQDDCAISFVLRYRSTRDAMGAVF